MTVKNKWNGNLYTVILIIDNKVTLRRVDGSEFIINQKEYEYNYRKVTDDKRKD